MRTIETYETDGSAQGRLYSWRVAWAVATHYFTGAGMSYQNPMLFVIFGDGSDTVIAAHSIYFQILGNHGFVGLFLFIAMWMATYRSAEWLRTNARSIPEARWTADLGAMVQVSLVGYAVGGAFLSLSYFDLPYDLMVLVVLARSWVVSGAPGSTNRKCRFSSMQACAKPKPDVAPDRHTLRYRAGQ